jgi:hypothetical protein
MSTKISCHIFGFTLKHLSIFSNNKLFSSKNGDIYGLKKSPYLSVLSLKLGLNDALAPLLPLCIRVKRLFLF